MRKADWITLDYLEFFCQQQSIMIGCKTGEDEVWISALGPHPSDLTSNQIHEILGQTAHFELRTAREEDMDLGSSTLLTREELELRIRRMMN